MAKIKIVAISDLHGYLPNDIEKSDIMLIAGDILPLNIQFNKLESEYWLNNDFSNWVINLPVDKVYMVAGNHDFFYENITKNKLNTFLNSCNNKLVYLENTLVIHDIDSMHELKIFGTPYCHIFGNWPFMREESYMEKKFEQIPDYCDIIISHDPPYSINKCDCILEEGHRRMDENKHLGNEPLSNRLKNVTYQLLVCGHIHSGDHNLVDKVVNVSLLNEYYHNVYKPFYYELNVMNESDEGYDEFLKNALENAEKYPESELYKKIKGKISNI